MSPLQPRSTAQWFLSADTIHLVFAMILMVVGFLSIAVSQICLGINLGILVIRWAFLKQRPPRTGLELSAGLLALWALVNIFFSTDWQTSLLFYRRFYIFSVIWIMAMVATSEPRRLALLGAALLGAMAISLYGEMRLVMETGSLFGARFSAMSNPMTSGSMLMMMVLLGTGFLLGRGHGRRVRLAVGAALVPILLGTMLTMTRSAVLGLLGGVSIMLLLSHRRMFFAFAASAVVALILLLSLGHTFLPHKYQLRLNWDYQVSGKNTQLRLEMWRGGWEMVKDRPVTGFGDRSLEEVCPDYYGDEDTLYFGHLHSNFAQMAVIWGIPGLVLGVFFLVMPLVLLLRRWRVLQRSARPFPVLGSWVLGACGVWTGFFLAGFTEWYLGDAETMLIYLALIGCALGPEDSMDTSPAG